MIITDSLLHLGALLKSTGPLPSDIRDELNDLEVALAKYGKAPGVQRRAYRIIQRVEGFLAGEPGVVWPVQDTCDPPTVTPAWSSSAPPPA